MTDYGPLQPLIGRWTDNKGVDVSPEPDGSEQSLYDETMVLEIYGKHFDYTDTNELHRA